MRHKKPGRYIYIRENLQTYRQPQHRTSQKRYLPIPYGEHVDDQTIVVVVGEDDKTEDCHDSPRDDDDGDDGGGDDGGNGDSCSTDES